MTPPLLIIISQECFMVIFFVLLISQVRVLTSYNISLGAVAKGALELESWEIRK